MKNIFYVFLISILPIIELRGAIPVGAALGIPFYLNYMAAVVGNMLPVPFILLFIPKILDFLARFKFFRPVVEWVRKKAHKYSGRIIEGENASAEVKKRRSRRFGGAFWGLLIFVMIPIPGTGAWTGSLIASLFALPKRSSFLAVLLGVLGEGVIMCLASYGVVGFLKIFL
jgi:uncharacterized membrane protein